jgi:hypothetical protein
VSAEPPLSGTADVGGGGPSVTVLVADDNDVALRLCRRVLEKAGYKVLMASDAQEAMSLALANSPDMILLDHAMPGMDSLEAMRQINLCGAGGTRGDMQPRRFGTVRALGSNSSSPWL